jgi:hypothetical protein
MCLASEMYSDSLYPPSGLYQATEVEDITAVYTTRKKRVQFDITFTSTHCREKPAKISKNSVSINEAVS